MATSLPGPLGRLDAGLRVDKKETERVNEGGGGEEWTDDDIF